MALGILNAPSLEIPREGSSESVFISPATDLYFNENDQSFYYYADGSFRLISGTNISSGPLAQFIDKALDENFPEVAITDAKIKEVVSALARRIKNRITDPSPSPYIVFTNGTLDLKTLNLLPHDRAHHATFSLPFAWLPSDLPHPNFDRYVARTFQDPEERLLIKEMIGYYLTPFDQEPAVFFLFGPPRTGKTTIIEFLQALFTPTFASSFSLEALTTNDTYIAELSGKLINIKDEDESERISGDKFKLLADHGILQARRLYQAPYSFRPYAKFLFSSNDLPNFKNIEGVTRRLHFLRFNSPLPVQDQDKDFDQKLLQEAPQIVRTCLLAFQQVLHRNFEFTEPQSSTETKDELILSAHPERTFIQEWTSVIPSDDESTWTPNHLLYSAYLNFCREKNHRPLNERNFHRRIASLPNIKLSRSTDTRKKNIRLLHDLSSAVVKEVI